MVNYGVALWFAILSLSPAICHEHADGDVDHSHGYGFFSPSPRLVSPCTADSELAPKCRHYHMVLFGIEITILPGCAALETGTLPAQHDSAIAWTADISGSLAAETSLSQDVDLPAQAQDSLGARTSLMQDSFHWTDLPAAPCAPPRALRSAIQVI